jgi:EAL and modified HD-GYP domain-containing signal transduction protein
MLDADLNAIISDLPLSQDIKLALTQKQGWLADCISLCLDFEKGIWHQMEDSCNRLNISYTDILKDYEIASDWAEDKIDELL